MQGLQSAMVHFFSYSIPTGVFPVFHSRGRNSYRLYEAWRFSIDAKNLTNRYYRVAGYDFGNQPISAANALGGVSQIGFYRPPRTYSGTIAYHF